MHSLGVIVSMLLAVLSTVINGQFDNDPYRYRQLSTENGLSCNNVTVVLRDSKGVMWVGTTKGLNRYTPGSNTVFNNEASDSTSISSDTILSLYEDYNGDLWVGTGSGINRYNKENNSFDRLLNTGVSSPSRNIRTIIQDVHSFIWAGSDSGLFRIHPVTFYYEQFCQSGNNNSLSHNEITALLRDHQGVIWIATHYGLNRFNKSSSDFTQLFYTAGSRNASAYNNSFYSLLETREKRLLAGNGSGKLFRVEKELFTLEHYTETNADTRITSIAETDEGRLIIGTGGDGLLQKYVNTEAADNFRDLPSGNINDLNYINVVYNDDHGTIWIGTADNGLILYHPESIIDNPFQPRIVITDFRLIDNIYSDHHDWSGLPDVVYKPREITLQHKQNSFTISFDVLNYINPERNKSRYMLEGFDSDWRDSGTERSANYTNLPPGKYRFRVIGSNNSGLWNTDGLSLRITVESDFFSSVWFYIVIIAGLSGILAFILIRRARKNTLRRHNIERLYIEKNLEVERKNLQLERQHEAILYQSEAIKQSHINISKAYQDIKVISEFGQRLTSMLKLESIYAMLNSTIPSIIELTSYAIGIYDPEEKLIAYRGYSVETDKSVSFSGKIRNDNSFAARCMSSNDELYIANYNERIVSDDDKFFVSQFARQPNSLLFIPLVIENKALGILSVHHARKNMYTRNERNTLLALGSYLSVAIDNARAYELIHQKNDDLRQAYNELKKREQELEHYSEKITSVNKKLKKANKELENYRNHLEILVEKRTRDLQKAKEKAEESDMLKSKFLANMSHEIRTPMNAILGFANLLAEPGLTDGKKLKCIHLINGNVDSLLSLIDDILDISKIEANEISISKLPCNLNEMLHDLHATFNEIRDLNNKKYVKILLSKNIEALNLTILTDPYRLRQILTNLLGNALKFADKGEIRFGYDIVQDEHGDRSVYFYVSDTGIGIPEDKLKIIFERFGKVDHYLKGQIYRGVGLGLAISKSLVELLGGKISVESFVNKGSKFYFSLPLHEAEKPKTRKMPEESSKTTAVNLKDKTILVVEDEESNIFLIQSILEKENCKVLLVHTGKEAIELCRENPDIDLVFMDIKMPEMDGYEATGEIKKFRSDLPVIAQTAYAVAGERDKSISAGCDDYISKPFMAKDLIALAKKHLRKRKK